MLFGLLCVVLPGNACTGPNGSWSAPDGAFTVRVSKWQGGHKAAVSLTYDASWSERHQHVVDAIVERGLRLDFEAVTANFEDAEGQARVTVMRERMQPQGIHFFGHGHQHLSHDKLSYSEALDSFRKCYDLMASWGLNPRAYAYPYSSGRSSQTQRAVREAGFLLARGGTSRSGYNILPGDHVEPLNWYFLPSVMVADVEANAAAPDSHEAVARLLSGALESRAWIILTYHSIGIPGGYAYYPMSEFEKDLEFVADNDFWAANLDDVGLYVRERAGFKVEIEAVGTGDESRAYRLAFSDGLANDKYDRPLTIDLQFAPDPGVRGITVSPGIGGRSRFEVRGNALRLDAVPDEKTRLLLLQ